MMRNTVSTCLLAIGIILIAIGLISGSIFASDGFGNFQILIAISWWLSGIVSGFLFIGLAEIVNLLQKLLDRNNAVSRLISSMPSSNPGENVVGEASNSPTIREMNEDDSVIKIKDLTILIDSERMKGEFWITNCTCPKSVP